MDQASCPRCRHALLRGPRCTWCGLALEAELRTTPPPTLEAWAVRRTWGLALGVASGALWLIWVFRAGGGIGGSRPSPSPPAYVIAERAPATSAPDDALLEGHRLFNLGQFRPAIVEYDKALARTPNHAELWYWRSLAAARGGDADEAVRGFQKSIELDPARLDSYLQLDAVLSQRGEWGTIIAMWTKLIEREPSNARAYLERGGAALHNGDRQGAVQDAEAACRLGLQQACTIAARYR